MLFSKLQPYSCWRQVLALTVRRHASTGSGVGKTGKEVTLVVSSLRIDTVAAAGLDISRKQIWEACLDGQVTINGEPIKKKSSSVKEGDVIEVDTVLKPKTSELSDVEGDWPVKRGRVVVKEIGTQTRKGSHHLTIIRHKQFALFNKRLLSTLATFTRIS